MINLDEPVVMGILNLTPDSFFDGGKYNDTEKITRQIETMIGQGATIIDLGAFSSRPNADVVSEEEELNRLLPILEHLKPLCADVLISIDTYRSSVADAALKGGADMINDISGGQMDQGMFEVVAQYDAPYVLMHMQGTPQTMQDNPHYDNVVEEVIAFFKIQIDRLQKLGHSKIILDPGFGFGKTVEHNYELLNRLDNIVALGYPVLVGVSRKSMINKVLYTTPEEALNGTTVLNTIALMKGAKILRVHDVKQAKESIALVNQINKLQ